MDVHPWQVENPGQKAGCVGQQVFTSSPITRHSLNQTQGETRQEMGEIAQKNAQFLSLIFLEGNHLKIYILFQPILQSHTQSSA